MTETVPADTLERLVPDELRSGEATGDETLRLHLERYAFAARCCPPGRLLDMACGVGYGTRQLADHVAGLTAALGVDVSEEAVAYARRRYAGPRTAFRVGDALRFSDAEGFDAIVSLETIEHVERPDALAANLARLLRPGGVLVASVPVTPSVDVNPHHRHDFTARSFRRLFEPLGLVAGDALRQVQPVALATVLRRDEARMAEMRRNLLGWYLRHPGSLLRRIAATLRHGLDIHYLTQAWRRPGPPP